MSKDKLPRCSPPESRAELQLIEHPLAGLAPRCNPAAPVVSGGDLPGEWMGDTGLGGGRQAHLRERHRTRTPNLNSSAQNNEGTMGVFSRRDEVEQLCAVLISTIWKTQGPNEEFGQEI